jgi:hypothetical protein
VYLDGKIHVDFFLPISCLSTNRSHNDILIKLTKAVGKLPNFVIYIEYTFIHFGMSISCKQRTLLISTAPHICPTYFHNQNITDCSDQKWKGPSFLHRKAAQSILNKYKSGALFSIKLLLYIEKYVYYHKNDGFASIFSMMRGVWNLNSSLDHLL